MKNENNNNLLNNFTRLRKISNQRYFIQLLWLLSKFNHVLFTVSAALRNLEISQKKIKIIAGCTKTCIRIKTVDIGIFSLLISMHEYAV